MIRIPVLLISHQNVTSDTDTFALPVNDGVLWWWDEFEDPIPGRAGSELNEVRRNDIDLVHPAHVDVDATYIEKNEILV